MSLNQISTLKKTFFSDDEKVSLEENIKLEASFSKEEKVKLKGHLWILFPWGTGTWCSIKNFGT